MLRFRLVLASLMVLSLSPFSLVRGGDGFPPFGAWVYGTGHVPTARHARVRTVYRSHGWGGYGHVTTHVRYGGFHHHHYRPWVSYRVAYPSVYYYRPFPIYTYPIYTYPVFSAPVYYGPLCSTPATSSVGVALAASQPNRIYNLTKPSVTGRVLNTKSLLTPANLSLAATLPNSAASARLVATGTNAAHGQVKHNIPAKTLQVADTLLRIGGYAEAAQAYARLANRYGASNLLYGRRFVAQAAAGDVNQAEVVVELASASGFHILAEDLPSGSLNELLDAPVLVASISEQLAKRALNRVEDPLRLKSVATWMRLSGDNERATVFFQRAEQLEDVAALPKVDRSKTVLASLE